MKKLRIPPVPVHCRGIINTRKSSFKYVNCENGWTSLSLNDCVSIHNIWWMNWAPFSSNNCRRGRGMGWYPDMGSHATWVQCSILGLLNFKSNDLKINKIGNIQKTWLEFFTKFKKLKISSATYRSKITTFTCKKFKSCFLNIANFIDF